MNDVINKQKFNKNKNYNNNLDYFYNLDELDNQNPEFLLWNIFENSGNIEDFLIYKEFQNIYNNF